MGLPDLATLLATMTSSESTFATLQELVIEGSYDPQKASMLLRQLFAHDAELNDDAPSRQLFRFNVLTLQNSKRPLVLLQLPSTFNPEAWSFTFYEGLLRIPTSDFIEKTVCELGCGNGWVSIALAASYPVRLVHGYDINPKAVVAAKLNLLLNSFDEDGKSVVDEEGIPLLSKVKFDVSDLLGHALKQRLRYDKIIGCIPQVLNPNPESLSPSVIGEFNDDKLHDLSNYCDPQGYIEDQFGLGLIARAIDQSISCLKPWGSLIFNLGGRPGRRTIETLFQRRGLTINEIWTTQVAQAMDTQIPKLLEIEQRTEHRFEFYLRNESKVALSASTAKAYLDNGGAVFHSLSVYEAHWPAQKDVEQIIRFVSRKEFHNIHEKLDLSETDSEIYRERTKFMSFLATSLNETAGIPYGPTEGLEVLRDALADFFQCYFDVPFDKEHFVIAPTRQSIVANHILVFAPKRVLIDAALLAGPGGEQIRYAASLRNCQVLEIPIKETLTVELVSKIKPGLLITGLNDYENQSYYPLKRLIRTAGENNCRMILDISPHVDLSSRPGENAALQFIRDHTMPNHVMFMAGFVKNRVYQDLELCFAFCENRDYQNLLCRAAEFTYCRAPIYLQLYYERIVSDLLTFHLREMRTSLQTLKIRARNEDPTIGTEVVPCVAEAFSHETIGNTGLTLKEDTIRLDYGENCLAIPTELKSSLFEAFSIKDLDPYSVDSKVRVVENVAQKYDLRGISRQQILEGLGVSPLFGGFLKVLAKQRGTLLCPTGCYGEFVSAATMMGVNLRQCPTFARDGFRIDAVSFANYLNDQSQGANTWLYLNAPIANPSSQGYTRQQIRDLVKVCRQHRIGVVFDATFESLAFNPATHRLSFEDVNGVDWILLDTFSKGFAAGGLRYGYAVCSHADLALAIIQTGVLLPHRTVRYTVARIFDKLSAADAGIQTYLQETRKTLQERGQMLAAVLRKKGWEVLDPDGGLFLLARPAQLLGKKHQTANGLNWAISGDNIAEFIFHQCGVLLNGPSWTGVPEFLRFVFSVTESEFQEALKRLGKLP